MGALSRMQEIKHCLECKRSPVRILPKEVDVFFYINHFHVFPCQYSVYDCMCCEVHIHSNSIVIVCVN